MLLLGYLVCQGLLGLYYFYHGNKGEALASFKNATTAESNGDDLANLGVINQLMKRNTIQRWEKHAPQYALPFAFHLLESSFGSLWIFPLRMSKCFNVKRQARLHSPLPGTRTSGSSASFFHFTVAYHVHHIKLSQTIIFHTHPNSIGLGVAFSMHFFLCVSNWKGAKLWRIRSFSGELQLAEGSCAGYGLFHLANASLYGMPD